MDNDIDVVMALCDTFSDSAESSDSWCGILNSSSSSSLSSEDAEHTKVNNFEKVIEEYTDDDFKKHLRLNRTTAMILIDRYKNSGFLNRAIRGRCRIFADKEIYLFLWYIGTTNTFREMGNLFGITKSSAWRVIKRVSEWLITIGHEFVKWPTESEARTNMMHFQKIPGVIGCIDCSHVKIKAPRNNTQDYFNRKHYYSVHLQAVVNADKKFIDVFVGEPGSLHDSRVLRRSQLYHRAMANRDALFPENSFILGDSAYSSCDWLISPYRDNGSLTVAQRQFNKLHSSTRIVVEKAFGLLKTRFRRLLHFTEQDHVETVVNLIICGCILHNLCIVQFDTQPVEIQPEDYVESAEDDQSAAFTNGDNLCSNRREELLLQLINDNNLVA